ncbi:MAG: tripartite-type tricarboxylate transporter receptor subunit TctC [Hyphomicrobiaceae bacterium]|jgi:tripartite-type tricarboxylate transporter receptor subunit TctC
MKMQTAIMALAAMGVLTIPATAAEFPSKPITIIVAYGAGGGTDATVRTVAEPVSKALGQPILVQNKPGAGGGVAATYVKNQPADGYTLIATGSLTYSFEPQVLKAQYAHTDFNHVAVISQFQEGFFTHPSRPYKNMKDVIALAKKENRSIKYASLYQLDRKIMGYVAKKEGIKIIPVPTKGGNGAVQAVLGNQVDFGVSGGSFGPHAANGAVRVIGAMTAESMPRFPKVAGMHANGWKVGSENFLIISAPKGTPKDIVAKLAAAFKMGVQTDTVQALVKKRYMKDIFIGADKVNQAVADQYGRNKAMLEALK